MNTSEQKKVLLAKKKKKMEMITHKIMNLLVKAQRIADDESYTKTLEKVQKLQQ